MAFKIRSFHLARQDHTLAGHSLSPARWYPYSSNGQPPFQKRNWKRSRTPPVHSKRRLVGKSKVELAIILEWVISTRHSCTSPQRSSSDCFKYILGHQNFFWNTTYILLQDGIKVPLSQVKDHIWSLTVFNLVFSVQNDCAFSLIY